VQEIHQNHDHHSCVADATKPEPKTLTCFEQSLTPEPFNQVIAESNDEDDPPATFSIHTTMFEQFAKAIIGFVGFLILVLKVGIHLCRKSIKIMNTSLVVLMLQIQSRKR
jgi:hypothetical protein